LVFKFRSLEELNKLFLTKNRQKFQNSLKAFLSNQDSFSHKPDKLKKLEEKGGAGSEQVAEVSLSRYFRCLIKDLKAKNSQSFNYIKQLCEQINDKQIKQCSVCYDSQDTLKLTRCGHQLCKVCQAELSERAKKSEQKFVHCPICRESLSPGDFFSIKTVYVSLSSHSPGKASPRK